MRRYIEQSNALAPYLRLGSWLDYTTNMSGYDFRKGQHPHLWHSCAGEGAVHGIINGPPGPARSVRALVRSNTLISIHLKCGNGVIRHIANLGEELEFLHAQD